MALLRTSFPVGALGCNCSIVACPETSEALVIDPGDEAPRILAQLQKRGWKAVQVVHTHAHFDHVMGTGEVARSTGAETSLHQADRWLYDHVPDQLRLFGLGAAPVSTPTPTRELSGNEVLTFGRQEARVFHTPGHTPGSICVYLERAGETPLLFAGDTLFQGSIGRTDLPGGSFEQIVRSIQGPLFSLPEATVVVPGHGGETTIGQERKNNPFVGNQTRK
jgi:glyoxylase-like metal-dependent hydrolase (beta-lactamase superfamily II)